jgi:hypothetical protein
MRKHRVRKGHFSMKSVEDFTASVKRIAKDNPLVTAAGLGAGAAGLAASMGTGTAALMGAGSAIAAVKLTE